MQFRLSFFIACLFTLFTGCVTTPEYPVEPEISLLYMSDSTISAGNAIQFTIEFQDGDGDIGYQNPATDSCGPCDTNCYFNHPTVDLYYIDSRTGCIPFRTQIPFLEQKGSSRGLTGEIDFQTGGLLCEGEDPAPFETFYYTIMIRDRERNFSNRIRTPMITVRCP